jgi:galactokinase
MRVADEFRSRHDADPEAVASAPGRVNLIGEHLDYNGGPVLPMALDRRTWVAAARRDDGLLVVESLQQDGDVRVPVADLHSDRVEGWAAYVAGVVWALADQLADQLGGEGGGLAALPGLTVLVDGQVPLGAGLSSSAALECAVALATCAVVGRSVSGDDVVAACVRAENEYAGAATGSMDQTVAMFAEADQALLVDFADSSRRQVPWTPAGELLVIDTKVHHELNDGGYEARRRACEAAAEVLGVPHLAAASAEDLDRLTDPEQQVRARHVVSETARVHEAVTALEAGDWETFGRLLLDSHASLRDDFEVSCPELDVAVEAAVGAGAVGARMTGGGFGGSAIALLEPGSADRVKEAVTAAFAEAGFRAPEFLDVPAAGAGATLHDA